MVEKVGEIGEEEKELEERVSEQVKRRRKYLSVMKYLKHSV